MLLEQNNNALTNSFDYTFNFKPVHLYVNIVRYFCKGRSNSERKICEG